MKSGNILRRLSDSPLYGLLMLAVAVLAVVVPLTLTQREKPDLEFRLESRIPLFSAELEQSGFSVTYNNESIPGATKYVFTLLNTGSVPITEEDVKQQPGVRFEEETEIFLAQAIEMSPVHLPVSLVSEEPAAVSVVFALLNPGDFVQFCVYTKGEISESFHIFGRIAGITEIGFFDKTFVPVRATKRPSGWLIALWVFTGLCLILWAVSGRQVRASRRLRRVIAQEPDYIAEKIRCTKDAKGFIDGQLKYLLTDEKAKLLALARETPDSDEGLNELRTAIRASIEKRPAAFSAFVVFTICVLPGVVTLTTYLVS